MSDILKIRYAAARDAKSKPWTDPIPDEVQSLEGHPDLNRMWEKHSKLLWWWAHRLARMHGGETEDYIGTLVLKLNQVLHTFNESLGKFSTYYSYNMKWYVFSNFIKYESENKSINWAAARFTDVEVTELVTNYSFHEAGLQLYRVPDPDDDWALEVMENFETPEKCWKFMVMDLDERTKRILKMRYTGSTLDEVAKVFQVTRERVRQLQSIGIEKIRTSLIKLEKWIDLFRDKPKNQDKERE